MSISSQNAARAVLRASAATLLLAVSAASAFAQANLGSQGYGFPTGQLSARAEATGGSIAETDPLSPVNPATLALLQSRVIFFQIEPEYRTVKSGNVSEHTSVARYPVVFGAMPVGRGVVLSLASSTLLDRTSTTVFRTTQFITPTDSVPMTTTYHIDGAMNDVRLAAGWSPASWLRLGVGVHAITGHNRVDLTQEFADTVQFASYAQQTLLGFSGSGVSGGAQVFSNKFELSASGRWGGNLRVADEDTTLARANVPTRFGLSLTYTGIANSAISVRTSRENWSALTGLGSAGLDGVDAWDSSVGFDLAGPRFGSRVFFLRGGARTRTLPFRAAGKTVRENSFTAGTGSGFGNGRVLADLAIIRALRNADIGASEHAWTVSLGITVRP